jgi:hypothetical protein
VGGSGRVAAATPDDEGAIGAAARRDFFDVVGGEVGGWVGGSALVW